MDHRTKNVLAIVDSIVRLSKSDNAAAYSASVQQRPGLVRNADAASRERLAARFARRHRLAPGRRSSDPRTSTSPARPYGSRAIGPTHWSGHTHGRIEFRPLQSERSRYGRPAS
ncbi:HWE histidine kinase domain-containing protein [Rhizobium sp. SIMBA_035]